MNKLGKEISKLVNEIKGLSNVMLTSERLNSQRCIAKDIDTTKTIIDHEEKNEFTKEDIKNLAEEAKTIINTMLVSERLNSQRCIAKDIDTTKTIIDHKEVNKAQQDLDKKEIENIVKDLKGLLSEMLMSERTNSQRCIAKDIDTTRTIIDQKK